jgi:hypothetical protein
MKALGTCQEFEIIWAAGELAALFRTALLLELLAIP